MANSEFVVPITVVIGAVVHQDLRINLLQRTRITRLASADASAGIGYRNG